MIPSSPQRRYTKSSWSGNDGGNCVEWAFEWVGVYVRDSKDPAGPELLFTRPGWDAFVTAAAGGAAHPAVTVEAGGVHVRVDPAGPQLRFTHAEWDAFAAAARAGECQPVAV